MVILSRYSWTIALLGFLMCSTVSLADEPGVEGPSLGVGIHEASQADVPDDMPSVEGLADETRVAARRSRTETPSTVLRPEQSETPAQPPAKEETPKPAEKESAATPAAPAPQAAPSQPPVVEKTEPQKRELTQTQTAQRDRVRRALSSLSSQLLNTQDNTSAEALDACLPFGCSTQVVRAGSSNQKVNCIAALCSNVPFAGRGPLLLSGQHVAARIGFGFQQREGQFLAVLAQARVPADYGMRVEGKNLAVSDLVEFEKRSCRDRGDLSLKMVGLAYYVKEPDWNNDLNERWSVERMIAKELDKPLARVADGGADRLLGLSYAVLYRSEGGQSKDGQYDRARNYLDQCQELALRQQNSDGSWGPDSLLAKSASRDSVVQLGSTGNVLEWLALWMPPERLDDARIARAVDYVVQSLGNGRAQWNFKTLDTSTIGSIMHAAHALSVYDERFFQPADADNEKEPPAAKKPAASK
jgi:hypothetical protein